MYTGNPGYIWDERLSKCQHRASAEDTVPRVSMPSLWRTKLLMAQKDRVNEGLQVSENWSSGVHDMEPWGVGWFFFGPRTCSNILCSWQTEAHFFKTTQKWNARRCFFVFQCHNWHQQVFFGSIWRGCLNLPAFQRRCWATGLHRSWIMPWPRLSRSFARENARWSRKFQSPLGTKIYFGFGISQQNSDGLISLQGDVGPDWFLLGKRWSTSNHLLPFPKKKPQLDGMIWNLRCLGSPCSCWQWGVHLHHHGSCARLGL